MPTKRDILRLRMAMATLPDELADLIADMADVYDHPHLVGASAFCTTMGSPLIGTHPGLFRNAKHVSIASTDAFDEHHPHPGYTTAGVYINSGRSGNRNGRVRVVNGCYIDAGRKADRTDVVAFANRDHSDNDPVFGICVYLGRGVLPQDPMAGREAVEH